MVILLDITKLLRTLWVLVALIAATSYPPSTVSAADAPESICLGCHNSEPVTVVLRTPHGHTSPVGEGGICESCHGPSINHLGAPTRVAPDVTFNKNDAVRTQNETCLNCHATGQMDWHASRHATAEVGCASCHKIHALADHVLQSAGQTATCFTCHAEQRAEFRRRSRHPVNEATMSCSDCHDPHGSKGPALLLQTTINDTCFQCHAEKRGPFLWEHPPAADDCATCHTPHGSTHQRLLKNRSPFLCQACHSEAQHPSTLYSGTGLPSATPGRSLLGGACLNCHPMVHGSNHPSGAALTR